MCVSQKELQEGAAVLEEVEGVGSVLQSQAVSSLRVLNIQGYTHQTSCPGHGYTQTDTVRDTQTDTVRDTQAAIRPSLHT